MKVVINKCFGGFGLSEKAIEDCIGRGLPCTVWVEVDKDGRVRDEYKEPTALFVDNTTLSGPDRDSYVKMCGRYSIVGSRGDKALRTHPEVVRVVELLGEEADGNFAELKVVDIPFDSLEGWEITEYDGVETIEENHRSWS